MPANDTDRIRSTVFNWLESLESGMDRSTVQPGLIDDLSAIITPAEAVRDALRFAASVVELYDDAMMDSCEMATSTDCADILNALADSYPFATPTPAATGREAVLQRWLARYKALIDADRTYEAEEVLRCINDVKALAPRADAVEKPAPAVEAVTDARAALREMVDYFGPATEGRAAAVVNAWADRIRPALRAALANAAPPTPARSGEDDDPRTALLEALIVRCDELIDKEHGIGLGFFLRRANPDDGLADFLHEILHDAAMLAARTATPRPDEGKTEGGR